MEFIRAIHIKIKVETNKRREVIDQEVESFEEAKTLLEDFHRLLKTN